MISKPQAPFSCSLLLALRFTSLPATCSCSIPALAPRGCTPLRVGVPPCLLLRSLLLIRSRPLIRPCCHPLAAVHAVRTGDQVLEWLRWKRTEEVGFDQSAASSDLKKWWGVETKRVKPCLDKICRLSKE